jgi:hypothetical protein
MHYKNGTEATAGDLVLHTEPFNQQVGIVTAGTPNATACNGEIHIIAVRSKSSLGSGPWIPMNPSSNWTVTLSDCEKIESAPVAEAAPEPAADAAENKEAVSAA